MKKERTELEIKRSNDLYHQATVMNLKDKLITLKQVARAKTISLKQYALTVKIAKDALASNCFKRISRALDYACTQCGDNTDYDMTLKYYAHKNNIITYEELVESLKK